MFNNFKRMNTFKTEFINKQYDYILANPLYGGDKNEKSVEYIKKENTIKENKKIIDEYIN